MEKETCEILLSIMTKSLYNDVFSSDFDDISNICKILENIKNNKLIKKEIEELNEKIKYLQVKYDEFNELSYYSDSLYVKLRKIIHDEEVTKIRKENRKHRGN